MNERLVDGRPVANGLLLGFPGSGFERIRPFLRRVDLPRHSTLIAAGEKIATLYFPESAVCSELVRLRDGATAEINLVGREGMAGLEGWLGSATVGLEVMTIVGGTLLALPLDALRALGDADDRIRPLLDRYVLAVHAVRAIAAACDRLHPVQVRLVRWLLRTGDRLDEDDFLLTQDDIASLLGIARQSVTASALLLHEAGFIDYRHGHLRIVDRPGLERAACECYWNVRGQWEALRKTQTATEAWDGAPGASGIPGTHPGRPAPQHASAARDEGGDRQPR
jgi:CRP-like cAMP-binding protein